MPVCVRVYGPSFLIGLLVSLLHWLFAGETEGGFLAYAVLGLVCALCFYRAVQLHVFWKVVGIMTIPVVANVLHALLSGVWILKYLYDVRYSLLLLTLLMFFLWRTATYEKENERTFHKLTRIQQ